jgi:gluconolactonase
LLVLTGSIFIFDKPITYPNLMKNLLLALLLLAPFITFAQNPVEKYPVDSASVVHPGVPKGEILKFAFANSKIYPGTWREYSVYIPAEYDPAKPACVFVDQDGIQFKSPTVFDNLIYSKEMPVTIGIYITPGRVVAKDTTALDRYNRSFEFDGLGDAYARFVLDEILPDVEKHKASNGRAIVLSHNGNDRMIAGTSSGAVCAFTAAWEHPDAFSRVMSGIGTYVSLRGADRYPGLIRKYEPKPIRVFLQDGANDLNIYGGDWFYANQMMERALTFAGYEVNHAWGEGAHTGNQSTAIFADAMRWLWKGYPAPVATGKSKNTMLGDILKDGEGWKVIDYGIKGEYEPDKILCDLAAKPDGSVNFGGINGRTEYSVSVLAGNSLIGYSDNMHKVNLYADQRAAKIIKSYIKANKTIDESIIYQKGKEVIPHLVQGNDIIKAQTPGHLFYMTGADGTPDAGKISFVKKDYSKVVVNKGLNNPYGLALTPDHSQLYVTEENSHWVWIYNVNADGTLSNKQRYGWLHSPDTSDNAKPRGIKVLPLPVGAGPATDLCFGGKDFDELYVTCSDKIYHRTLKAHGMNDFDTLIKPAKPKL